MLLGEACVPWKFASLLPRIMAKPNSVSLRIPTPLVGIIAPRSGGQLMLEMTSSFGCCYEVVVTQESVTSKDLMRLMMQ